MTSYCLNNISQSEGVSQRFYDEISKFWKFQYLVCVLMNPLVWMNPSPDDPSPDDPYISNEPCKSCLLYRFVSVVFMQHMNS